MPRTFDWTKYAARSLPWDLDEPVELEAVEGRLLRYRLTRGNQERTMVVEMTGSLLSSTDRASPLDELVRTGGRWLVEENARRTEPPQRIVIHSVGWSIRPREGCYEPGDFVFVLEGTAWVEAVFQRHGDPDESVAVQDDRVEGGEYRRDVAFVRRVDAGGVERYRYDHVRAAPPSA